MPTHIFIWADDILMAAHLLGATQDRTLCGMQHMADEGKDACYAISVRSEPGIWDGVGEDDRCVTCVDTVIAGHRYFLESIPSDLEIADD